MIVTEEEKEDKKKKISEEIEIKPKKTNQLFPKGSKISAKSFSRFSEKSEDDIINKQNIAKGMEFNSFSKLGGNFDYNQLMKSFKRTGFQSSMLHNAIKIIQNMLQLRFKDGKNDKRNITIILGYTSNMVSCGVRELIRYLVEHSLVDAIVTTTGGIEEDFMKCLSDTYLGKFTMDGKTMRKSGLNRIGNLIVPNDNYLKFEDFLYEILDGCLADQKERKYVLTPTKLIDMMGRDIKDESSVYYWTWKNKIPVYCPCITDGSVGDMIYMHSFKKPGLVVDLLGDVKKINDQAVNSKQVGIICLGGGMPKFHVSNATKMRGGADFAVYVNTGAQFDGSNSGASSENDKTNMFVRKGGKVVKVFAEATLVFPIIMANTFVKYRERYRKKKKHKKKFFCFC